MVKPRIIVAGASGKTGRLVVTELVNAGYPVRAIVHREGGRSARLEAQGAEVRVSAEVRFAGPSMPLLNGPSDGLAPPPVPFSNELFVPQGFQRRDATRPVRGNPAGQ